MNSLLERSRTKSCTRVVDEALKWGNFSINLRRSFYDSGESFICFAMVVICLLLFTINFKKNGKKLIY